MIYSDYDSYDGQNMDEDLSAAAENLSWTEEEVRTLLPPELLELPRSTPSKLSLILKNLLKLFISFRKTS